MNGALGRAPPTSEKRGRLAAEGMGGICRVVRLNDDEVRDDIDISL